MIAWALWGLSMLLAAISGGIVLATLDAPVPDTWGFRGYWALVAPIVATPGLLVALRRPDNPVGWLLLVAALSDAYGGFAQEYATYAVIVAPGSLPGALALAWVNSWSFGIFAVTLLVLVPLLFPTGRPLTERWRPLLGGSAVFMLAIFITFGLRPGPLENASFFDNPIALSGALADARSALLPPLLFLAAAVAVASGAAAILRFRRSRGVERQQLKWVALSAALVTLGMLAILATQSPQQTNTSKPAQVFMVFAFSTLPVAIGIAMLRYRLYDVDLIINRALVYGALTAILGASYVMLVVLFQTVLRPVTGGSEISVAASTLATVALIQPLRQRIQDAVDRRFYRARYDAQRVVDTFAAHLRDRLDLDDVRVQLLGTVHAAMHPRAASVWLRGGDR